MQCFVFNCKTPIHIGKHSADPKRPYYADCIYWFATKHNKRDDSRHSTLSICLVVEASCICTMGIRAWWNKHVNCIFVCLLQTRASSNASCKHVARLYILCSRATRCSKVRPLNLTTWIRRQNDRTQLTATPKSNYVYIHHAMYGAIYNG